MSIIWAGLVSPVDLSTGNVQEATANLLNQLKVSLHRRCFG